MNIREIEEQLGIPRASVRYYEKEGLLHPRRGSNNYRDYSEEDAAALRKIKLLRRLDMPIETIRAVQAGELPLTGALERQAALLENESARLDSARAICRAMAADRVTYAALEPARYEGLSLPGPASTPPEEPRRPPVEETQWAFDPWQRYWARTFDLSLTGAAGWAVMTLGFRVSVLGMAGLPRWLFQAVSLALSWGVLLLLEPLLLCTWGTTPGKWLLGLELRSKQGRKLTFRQGLRAVAAIGLALLLIPVRMECSVQALRPPNRGEVTAAEFAENVSEVSRMLGRSLWVDEEGFRLSRSKRTVMVLVDSDEDDWQERRYGERYEDESAYALELDGDGFVTAVRMEQAGGFSDGDGEWAFLPLEDARIITMAFRGAWCGGREMLRGPVMEALEAPDGWTGQPVREGAFTLTLSLEQEGYDTGGGYLLPREGAEEGRYRFSLRLERAGG